MIAAGLRLKSASSFDEGARALSDTPLSGIGAARTTFCVRKAIASRRVEMSNIWRLLFGLPERGVG